MRIIYFGMPCTFSLAPLQALLATEHEVAAVIVPGATAHNADPVLPIHRVLPPARLVGLPLLNPYVTTGLVQLAWEHAIPVWEVAQLAAPQTSAIIAALQPDLAVVACFSRRIPPQLLRLPRLGFLNLHPSLLPTYRGPAPLFWTFRDGVQATGVTLHLMDEHFDTGPIVLQAPLVLPDGCSGPQADHLCSTVAAGLLVETLHALGPGMLPAHPQPAGGTYAPWPDSKDFAISTTWSAQHAYNFICGTVDWQQLYPVTIGDQRLYLQSAVSYTPHERGGRPIVPHGRQLRIQFNPGILQAQLAPEEL